MKSRQSFLRKDLFVWSESPPSHLRSEVSNDSADARLNTRIADTTSDASYARIEPSRQILFCSSSIKHFPKQTYWFDRHEFGSWIRWKSTLIVQVLGGGFESAIDGSKPA